MKNSTRRIVCILLAALLILGIAVPVFAAEDAQPVFRSYVAIGDSIALKCGTDMTGRVTPLGYYEDSYADRIARHYGATDGYLVAGAGWRTQEALVAINPTYTGDDFLRDFQKEWGGYTLERIKSLQPVYTEAVRNADLITINLGNNNLLGTLFAAYAKSFERMTAGTALEKRALAIIEEARQKASSMEAIVFLLDAAKTICQVNILLHTALEDEYKAVSAFPASWDALMAEIRSLNPDAKIAVLGIYNPTPTYVGHLVGSDIGLTIGTMLTPITQPAIDILNRYMRSGSPYAKDYVFVDPSGVDLTGSYDGAHLGYVGHKTVADKLIAAIDKAYVCPHEHTELKNEIRATLLTLGYTGDEYCLDCGRTVSAGHLYAFWEGK